MRTVFPSAMVAHVWAQQTQDSGRNGRGSLFFEGDTIYSYGRHFPIAKFSGGAVYFTTRSYSVTTSGHMSTVRSALRGEQQIFHLDPSSWGNPLAALDEYRTRLDEAVLAAARARANQAWRIEQAEEIAREANAFAVIAGLPGRQFATKFSPEVLEGARVRARQAAAEKAAESRRKAAERAARLAASVEKWLAGEYATCHEARPIRLRINGDQIETTMRASVPVAHAPRVWKLVQACRATGREYQRNGHTEHVGHFAIDRVSADGTMRAGCHTLEYSELARIAGLLGLEG